AARRAPGAAHTHPARLPAARTLLRDSDLGRQGEAHRYGLCHRLDGLLRPDLGGQYRPCPWTGYQPRAECRVGPDHRTGQAGCQACRERAAMIRISAAQGETDANGWCRLRIEGLGLAAAQPVELYFKRGGERPPFLTEQGWQQAQHWLTFDDTRLDGSDLVLPIGPAQTWFLSDVATVEIGLQLPGSSTEPERARLAWPKIILDANAR